MTTLFIGLGQMGNPMARRYSTRHDTVLYDLGPVAQELADELGIGFLPTLESIPASVDTVILMVPTSAIVEGILVDQHVLERLPQGSLVIDMSSSLPDSTRRLAEAAAARGVGYVDAPVSGGKAKASTGELSIMVGGEPADVERALPHLTPMATTMTVVGPAGSGHAAKALNNLLSATNLAATAEILSVATRFGIEPKVMIDVINSSTGRSQSSEVKYPKHILTGTWDSHFAMDLMIKDLGIARDLAEASKISSPITASAFEVARAARERLGPGRDHTELARYYELLNGVSFQER